MNCRPLLIYPLLHANRLSSHFAPSKRYVLRIPVHVKRLLNILVRYRRRQRPLESVKVAELLRLRARSWEGLRELYAFGRCWWRLRRCKQRMEGTTCSSRRPGHFRLNRGGRRLRRRCDL